MNKKAFLYGYNMEKQGANEIEPIIEDIDALDIPPGISAHKAKALLAKIKGEKKLKRLAGIGGQQAAIDLLRATTSVPGAGLLSEGERDKSWLEKYWPYLVGGGALGVGGLGAYSLLSDDEEEEED